MIQDYLSKKIVSHNSSGKTTVVAICGAADLGKSYLSQKIIELIRRKGLTANHLALDSYLIPRPLRNEKGLSGYAIKSYDFETTINDLNALKNGRPIALKTYNHNIGKCNDQSTEINPSQILILDGLHAMHPSILNQIDLSIFLYTTDDYLKQIRSEADLVKRNYSIEFSKEIAESECNAYRMFIEPYKEKADHLIFLKSKWDYHVITC